MTLSDYDNDDDDDDDGEVDVDGVIGEVFVEV